MRTKKKIIAILLIATILSSFVPNLITYAEVAGEPNFTMNIKGTTDTTKTVEVGEIVSVDVSFTNGMGYNEDEELQKFLSIIIGYDPTALELIPDYIDETQGPQLLSGMSLNGDIAPGATLIIGGPADNSVFITYNTMLGIAEEGRAATLKFKVLKGGSHTLKFDAIAYDDGKDTDASKTECTSASTVTITGDVPMTDLTITPDGIAYVKKGETITLTATKQPEGTTNTDEIKWSSNDASIATVDENGVVTAVTTEKDKTITFVTAKCVVGDKVFERSVTIVVENPMTGLTINKTSATVNRNKTIQLVATRQPEDTFETSWPIEWESENTSIATVDDTGLVKGVSKGTTNIIANCGLHCGGLHKAVCAVTVNAELEGIIINAPLANGEIGEVEDVEIDKDKTVQLSVTPSPTDTTDTMNVTWSSEDTSIAEVDNTGLVTGKAYGDTNIVATVKTPDGREFTKKCKVTVNVYLESINITNGENGVLTLYKSQTEDLNVEYTPDKFTGEKTLIWESNKPEVAKVENGTVTAVSPGEATITATTLDGKITATIQVKVPKVEAETLIINKNNTSIEKGYTETLTATVLPENTTDEVVWSSDDESIVTVDQNGKVSAIKPGTTKVKAKAGEKEAECEVTVTCALDSLSFDLNKFDEDNDNVELDDNVGTLKIEAGKSSTTSLVVVKNPTDATAKLEDIEWRSKNESVATVTNGIITAVAPGTAVIEAELEGKIASCTVKVIVFLTGVEIENGAITLELFKNQTSQLKPVYTPTNATEIPEATWTSSDTSVATVDNQGNVKALKEGTTTITVDYGNGITATRNVSVKEIPADSIVIDQKFESLNRKQEIKLGTIMEPANSTDDVTWKSSDETIATVDDQGNLKALKAGKVTITATASSGKTDSMEIEIKDVVLESIEVSSKDQTIEEGNTTQINVKYNPSDVTDDLTVTYETSNASVATVDKDGKVTAKKAGDVVITVSVEAVQSDGTKKVVSSQVKLTVKEKPVTATPAQTQPVGAAPAPASPVAALTASPKTGDMNIVALVVMMVVSLAGMIITIKNKKI